MDLFCPHCTKRVTVPDDKSGQVMSCPLCAKQFMAPSLAPAVPAPPPPAPPLTSDSTYATTPSSPPANLPAHEPPPLPGEPPPSPPAPLPPGEYTRSCTCCLRANWLVFVPLVCVVLILFVLSFFNWSSNHWLWGLAFAADPLVLSLTTYTVLMILAFILTAIVTVLDLVPVPPGLAPVIMWKNLPLGLFLGLAFLFLVYDSLQGSYGTPSPHPVLTAESIALRLHALAMLSSFGMFWLHLRKQKNLPPPKLEAHW
jgi:hypothetical protein